MKNLSNSNIVGINGGCFSYYAGWFLRQAFSPGTPSAEDIASGAVHHATCDH